MNKLGSRPLRMTAVVLVTLCAALATACGDDKGGTITPTSPPGPGQVSPAAPVGSSTGVGPVSAGPSSPTSTGTPPAAVSPAGDGGAAGPVQTGAAGLPTNVCKVLQDNGCISCHQNPPAAGATMSLQWRADFAGKAKDGTPMAAKVLARAADARAPMPPVTTMRPLMPATDLAVLRTWIEGGMVGAASEQCVESAAAPTHQKGVEWAYQPWPEGECEYVMTVGAHGANGTPRAMDDSAFSPPAQETGYHCFYEKVPWGTKKVQALAIRAKLEGPDDGAIVHHMVLSAREAGSQSSALGGPTPSRPGQHAPCDNPSGSTVGVWAPGPHTQVTFPQDVGVMMPSGESYMELQVHYNNVKAGQKSRVAFDICATSKLRPQEAAVHWLGYDNALLAIPLAPLGPDFQPQLDNQGNGSATGSCKAKQRTRVLWFAPHMHELGKHAKLEIVRKNGTIEKLHDAPFDFREQTAYFQPEVWVEQGETIRTTCTWNKTRPIVFGFASDEEMCFFYTLSYPVGALAGQGAEQGVTGGALNCAGAM
jgi:hypothetical protein